MLYHKNGSEVRAYDAEGNDYTGAVVSDCWVRLNARGLHLNVSRGDGFVVSYPVRETDIVGGADDPHETDENSESPESDVAAIYDRWNLDPKKVYEFFDSTLRAEVVPVCRPDDPDGAFATHSADCARQMLHDPNFHSAMEGATRNEKEAVACDLTGARKR